MNKNKNKLFSAIGFVFLVWTQIVHSTPTAIERLGWNNRYLGYDGTQEYLVGFDLQQLHSDLQIDYRAAIDFLRQYELNKFRIWIYTSWYGTDEGGENVLHPWRVVQSGGSRKFDIDQWDPDFWLRLRDVIAYARSRGVVVEISLFSIQEAVNYFRDGDGREYAFRATENIQGFGQPGPDGDFYPEFFDLDYAESGKTLSDYQFNLVNKTLDELEEFDNVYFELVNEAPGPHGHFADPHYLNWVSAMSAHIKSRTDRLITAHAHGYADASDVQRGVVTFQEIQDFVDSVAAIPTIDGLNFHWHADEASQVSDYLNAHQGHGLILSNNEGGFYFRWDNSVTPRTSSRDAARLNKELRHGWGHLMAGGYYLAYQGPVELFGDAVSAEMAEAMQAMRSIVESIPNWYRLRPVKSDGTEFDTDIQSAPGSVREMMADPGNTYLLYFSGTKGVQPVIMDLPSGAYDYTWYDVTSNNVVLGAGSVEGVDDAIIPPPPIDSWSGESGLALTVTPYSNKPPVIDPIGSQTVNPGEALTFTVEATDYSGSPALSADLSGLPADNNAEFDEDTGNFSWMPLVTNSGNTYPVVFTATDAVDPSLFDTETVNITVRDPSSAVTVQYRIAATSDDAEQRSSGSASSLASSDLELVRDRDDQVVGMRFQGIAVPRGSTITNAYLQFQVDEATSTSTSLQIRGELTANAAAFAQTTFNISSRPSTAATVTWAPPAWTSVGASGADQRTPNLGPIIQEIIDQPDWSSGNALVLIVSGTGKRVAESYDGARSGAPLLHIEYGAGMPAAAAPTFGPVPGNYVDSVGVKLDTATPNAFIYYTLDGSDPDPGTTGTYSYTRGSDISLSTTTTIKALAKRSGYRDSAVSQGRFTITENNSNNRPVLDPIGNQTVNQGETLTFTVEATDYSGSPALSADLSGLPADNNAEFGEDTGNFSWMPLVTDSGNTYPVVFTATDAVDPSLFDTETVNITVRDPSSAVTVQYRIAATSDDAEQRSSGSASSLASSDLELVRDRDDQVVGMRFQGIAVPRGSTITNAYLQFQVDEATSTSTSLQIRGELTVNAAAFAQTTFNISSRPSTAATVTWAPPAWTSVGASGADQRTPNLGPIIQEIIDQPDWSSGNALVLIVSGTGKRVAESYDGARSGAPLLHIEYGAGMPAAAAPTFGPVPGNYVDSVGVKLDTATPNAFIYYTLDGSDPDPGTTGTYSYTRGSDISLSTTTTIKALTKRSGYRDSAVSQGRFTITENNSNNRPVLDPIGNQTVNQSETLTFTVEAADDSGSPALSADLSGLPADNNAEFDEDTGNFSWMPLVTDSGNTYPVVFTATDAVDPSLFDTETVNITVRDPSSAVTVQYRIAATSDDAEQRSSGSVSSLASSDLELVRDRDDQVVGMRFQGIAVPRDSTITNAYLQFQVDEATSTSTSLQIRGELTANAAAFAQTTFNISSRPSTAATVTWAPPAWTSVGASGADQRTPNLGPVIQEIVDQPDWSSGNALVLIVSGTGKRVAESYDGARSGAPLLHIEYSQ